MEIIPRARKRGEERGEAKKRLINIENYHHHQEIKGKISREARAGVIVSIFLAQDALALLVFLPPSSPL